MSDLSSEDLCSRRVFDWRVVTRMNDPPTYAFSAHRTAQDAERARNAIGSEQDARHAVHYRAVYRLRTLIGENAFSSCTIIRVDVSGAGYPFTEPSAWAVEDGTSQTPWSPHFRRGLPVCNGSIWRPDGRVLLGHYLIHLARLLNWDEHVSADYGGYNPSAVKWWHTYLRRPITPGLRYPALPVDLLYGKVSVRDAERFRPVGVRTPVHRGAFRPVTVSGSAVSPAQK